MTPWCVIEIDLMCPLWSPQAVAARVRRVGMRPIPSGRAKILDQQAANLEKCSEGKGKGLPDGLITSPLAQDYSFAARTAKYVIR
jgi:hypothetical protein